MTHEQYTPVRVRTDRLLDQGASRGDIGWVIEIHQDVDGLAYEVEFMDESGHTRALVVGRFDDFEPAPSLPDGRSAG